MKEYDYIIAGAGASGLSLLYYLLQYDNQRTKKILLIDNELKNTNDKTWCFWQKEVSPFESCVTKTWENLDFLSPSFSKTLDIKPYKYKMIESKNFYDFCFNEIKKYPNVEIIIDNIKEIKENGFLITEKNEFKAKFIFNSAFRNINIDPNKYYLLQHFKGYFIKTPNNVFNTDKATLMDFRINQENECRFVYVLPFSEKEALIEFTIFSENLLKKEEYDIELKNYIKDFLSISQYEIIRDEFGVIPMTNVKIKDIQSEHLINIGTAGGFTKASTGYTFSFIQKQCKNIAENLSLYGKLQLIKRNKKYDIFDTIFLSVLSDKNYESRNVFIDMFSKLNPDICLKFLDEETTIIEDLNIMNSVEKYQFIKSTFKEIFKLGAI
jgi:lycopene beta-cyclase